MRIQFKSYSTGEKKQTKYYYKIVLYINQCY